MTDALTWIKNVFKVQEKRQRDKQQKQRRNEATQTDPAYFRAACLALFPIALIYKQRNENEMEQR